jgi:hypothetical protein
MQNILLQLSQNASIMHLGSELDCMVMHLSSSGNASHAFWLGMQKISLHRLRDVPTANPFARLPVVRYSVCLFARQSES